MPPTPRLRNLDWGSNIWFWGSVKRRGAAVGSIWAEFQLKRSHEDPFRHKILGFVRPALPSYWPNYCFVLTSDHLVLTNDDLVVNIDYLVVTIDHLVVTNDYLVLTNDYLVLTSDYLVVTIDYLALINHYLVLTCD